MNTRDGYIKPCYIYKGVRKSIQVHYGKPITIYTPVWKLDQKEKSKYIPHQGYQEQERRK